MKKDLWYYTRYLWVKLMRAGAKSGCHQMPERSFFFRQYQFPVCARCCGVLIGEIIAVLYFLKKRKVFSFIASYVCASIMFLDWFAQFTGKLKSTNTRRLITGILGGFGCWSTIISLTYRIFNKIISFASGREN